MSDAPPSYEEANPPYVAPGGSQSYQPQQYPPTEPTYPTKTPYPTGDSQPVPSSGGNTVTPTVVTQPAHTTVVITDNYKHGFRTTPVEMDCPKCHQHIYTKVSFHVGTLTWLLAGAICLVGCIFGCCLVPFCVDGCKNVVHSCPNCYHTVGVYRRM